MRELAGPSSWIPTKPVPSAKLGICWLPAEGQVAGIHRQLDGESAGLEDQRLGLHRPRESACSTQSGGLLRFSGAILHLHPTFSVSIVPHLLNTHLLIFANLSGPWASLHFLLPAFVAVCNLHTSPQPMDFWPGTPPIGDTGFSQNQPLNPAVPKVYQQHLTLTNSLLEEVLALAGSHFF